MKLLSFLLAIVLIFSLLPGCAPSQNAVDEDDARQTVQSTETSAETADPRLGIPDGLPETDFQKKEFLIATRDDAFPNCRHKLEAGAEAENGDILNDTVYRRNLQIEERFNCDINSKLMNEADEGTLTRELLKSVNAGIFFADVAIGHMINMSSTALQNAFCNWNAVPHVDFDKIWWNKDANEQLQVKGVSFFAYSDLLITGLDQTYCMFFNKDMYQTYGLTENLYQTVKDGKWTLGKLNELIKGTYKDVDGDGAATYSDTYGLCTNAYSGIVAWNWSLGNRIMSYGSEGYPEHVLNNEHTVNIVNKLYELLYNNPDASVVTVEKRTDSIPWYEHAVVMFRENKTLFAQGCIGETNSMLRDYEGNYGILPMPKWDEKQDIYRTMVDGHGPLIGIPMTSSDNAEMIGVIMEAMTAESYKQVIPVYFDIALKYKQLRDEDSYLMLDYIKNGITFDFGYLYDGWKGFGFYLGEILRSKKSDFTSYYEKKERTVIKYFESVFEVHENLLEE